MKLFANNLSRCIQTLATTDSSRRAPLKIFPSFRAGTGSERVYGYACTRITMPDIRERNVCTKRVVVTLLFSLGSLHPTSSLAVTRACSLRIFRIGITVPRVYAASRRLTDENARPIRPHPMPRFGIDVSPRVYARVDSHPS